MKWRVYLCSVLFVFLGLCFGSFIINQNQKVSALSDLTYTLNSGSNSYTDLCGGSDTPSCSGYNYLYITTNFGFNTFTAYSGMTFRYNNIYQSTSRFYLNSPSVLLNISDFDIVGVNNINNTAPLPSDWSVTFTLSENNPYSVGSPSGSLSITENGTYDVTNYAEAVVEVPDTETIIQGDYHDDLVSINNSILICASVCLIIYFFYCIYRMLLRGRI